MSHNNGTGICEIRRLPCNLQTLSKHIKPPSHNAYEVSCLIGWRRRQLPTLLLRTGRHNDCGGGVRLLVAAPRDRSFLVIASDTTASVTCAIQFPLFWDARTHEPAIFAGLTGGLLSPAPSALALVVSRLAAPPY